MAGKLQPESIVIQNWDDWFENCNQLQPDLKAYEGLMEQYYDKQYSKTTEGREAAARAYRGRHKARFYETQTILPKWKKKKCILRMGIGFGVVFGVTLAASFVLGGQIPWGDGSLMTWLEQTAGDMGLPTAALQVVLAAVCGLPFGLLGWVPGLFHALRIKGLHKKMLSLEEKMKPRIGYLPPKYRNSIAVGVFYDLFCNYGAITFNQAVAACDEWMISNRSIGTSMAVLFDVPYENGNLAKQMVGADYNDSARDLYVNGAEDGAEHADPNLPEDIRTKTFQGVDDADKRLNEMVGLENVKAQVQQMKNRIEFYSSSGGAKKADRISGNHMVFLGPPGTGKTTVARIITKILYDFGYIQENKCVEIDGGYLKSPYVGQTTERTSAIIRYAMGGVLFIDEAYLLYDEKGGAGTEATGVLLKAMEDNKNDFVVILAGYEDNVNRLLASNEGFASRIKYKLYFEDFTVDEMVKIFRQLLKTYSQGHEYKISKEAMELLKAHFEKERRVPGFGNARVVRNALDVLLDMHADHFMKKEIPQEKKYVIVKKDVESYIKVRSKQMQEDGRNFIASRNLDNGVVSLAELKGRTKEGSVDPDKDLNALVGLEVVKKEIAQMKAQFEFYDGKVETEGNHMVFLGPPGTGKTTVAKIMTGYLYQMGLIQENSYVDINGDFLRGMYLGHTGKRTEAVVQYAQGMVLFVDEAYLLQSTDAGDNFGAEAVGVLLDAMEKYRKNFVVIFAGYEREMQAFLNMNSGLRSRISLEFHFASYSPHELSQMMNRLAKQDQFKVEKDVWLPLQQYLKVKREDPHFGNARFIRQFFEECKKSHILNYSKGLYQADQKFVITLQDVQPLLTDQGPVTAEDAGGWTDGDSM